MSIAVDPRTLAHNYIRDHALLDLVAGPSAKTIATRDPFTGEVIADIPSMSDDAVAAHVARASASLAAWRALSAGERATFLERMADIIDESYDELASIESLDAGKLYSSTRGWDVGNARDVLRFYAAEGPDYLARETTYQRARSVRQPVGVVATLAPWNAPLAVGVWKLAPALVAGCTVVMKAPERAPLSTLALARIAEEAGVPAGVVNVVTGDGGGAGNALVRDARVAAVSFTGGTAIASSIVTSSAGHLPRLLLELGGKGPNVVFGDADLDAAVPGTVVAMFDVAGQNCCAGSRTLVERTIYDEFVERVVAATEDLVVGDQFAPDTSMAPLIDRDHADRVMRTLSDARDAGDRLLCGGTLDGPNKTCFAPAIVEPRSLDGSLWTDEIFGPVACIAPFDDPADALALANSSDYGLSGSVWSGDVEKARRFALDANLGVVWTNTFGLFDIGVPWGGVKRSGYGRELTIATIDEYTQTKVIY
jgi:aldehyde dehydrogenase (NAD+)